MQTSYRFRDISSEKEEKGESKVLGVEPVAYLGGLGGKCLRIPCEKGSKIAPFLSLVMPHNRHSALGATLLFFFKAGEEGSPGDIF